MKNKLINAPHAALAWSGALLGLATVSESISFPVLFHFINDLISVEIEPILALAYPDFQHTFNAIKEAFIERCIRSTNDPNKRVGRDPMRKLDQGERFRGTMELAKSLSLKRPLPQLEASIALGLLYAINNIDSDNPGCKKITELYSKYNQSVEPILCYHGDAPSGHFTGFDPATDRIVIYRITEKFKLLKRLIEHSSSITKTRRLIQAVNFDPIYHRTIPVTQIMTSPHMKSFKNNSLLFGVTNPLLHQSGFALDTESGHIFYAKQFKPLHLSCEIVFVRHGETYGNCGQATKNGELDQSAIAKQIRNREKRIFQGNVDTAINQLTALGHQQAESAANKIKTELIDNGWVPDVVISSPLKRAIETAQPFVTQYHSKKNLITLNEVREMSFGDWENRRVCDFSENDPCHLFYKNQHALIKSSVDSENFFDVLIRAHHTLKQIDRTYPNKKIVIFSHSMFGAACCILLGLGKTAEHGNHLAFDGKRSDGSTYTMEHATPLPLNFKLACKHILKP